MNFLSQVKKYKEIEIEKLRNKQGINRFAQLFVASRKKPVFIAEVKPKSPSEGILYRGDPVELASIYKQAGVDAISILTDEQSFGGSLKLLHNISQTVTLPLLRKDFILSREQLIESLQNHADAVLLIVSLLNEKKLRELIKFSYSLGIVPVVEVASKQELKQAIKAGAQMIGINARDLQTLKVDYEKALGILKSVTKPIIPLLFSGIKTQEDIKKAVSCGARGILVGTGLLQAKNIAAKIRGLNREFVIKICGVKNEDQAKIVIKHKPTMIGLIFVENSARYVNKKTAQNIAALAHSRGIPVVGIFQNQPLSIVNDFVLSIPLDYVQFHGNESVEYCRKAHAPVIKKIILKNTVGVTKDYINQYLDVIDTFLIDRPKQGQGSLVNLNKVKELTEEYPVIVSGGLNKTNVDFVIKSLGNRLLGVDVSSGVESILGEKDEKLVKSFINLARRSYEQY